MESSPPPATQWEDLDSDEIGSVASEDLYENRPNRWTGTKSTWRDLTREERMLWRSMQQVVDRDLAVHLYDAFALKRQGLDPSTAQGLTVKLDDGQDDGQVAVWAPPKAWTAWPLQEKQVPGEGLFKEETDENEAFTLRKKEDKLPSTELQDELGATVLRLAKQRFRRRQRRRQHQTRHVPVQPSIETPSSPVPPRDENSEIEPLLPSSPPGMDEPSDDKTSDKTSDDDGPPPSSDAERRTTRDYEPTVSTDDHLSYHLLRPSIRHMLAQLDRTLTILHNARVAGLSHLSDSASSTEDDSDAGAGTPRRRGRPRRKPQPAGPISPSPPSRRGRPRKVHAPLGGETPEEMQLRVARQAHRRLPWTEKEQEAVFETWLRRGDLRRLRRLEQQQQQPHGQPGSPPRQQQQQPSPAANTETKIRRWGLRDWSDVLGAASLAGFPPGVIARSAQRCANLFGQGMMLRRLDERPSSRPGFATTEYRPDRIRLSASPSSDQDSDSDSSPPPEAILTQRRIASRQASLARSRSRSRSGISSPSPSSPSSHVSSGRRGRSPGQSASASASASHSRSHSRSRSRCSSAGLLFCPVQTCRRAADGFARRANLRRHVHLVHPGCAEDGQDGQDGHDESDDEVVGAVHVDGFLKTIHPGRGWRGEDVVARKRWRCRRQAGMDRDRDRDGDGDGESTT